MLQVARLSAQAMVENLNFGDDDLIDIGKFQRSKIDFYESEYSKLREENRKLKVLCNFNDVDYSQEIEETEYADVLQYTEIEIKKQEEDLMAFNKMVEEVLPIDTEDYASFVIEEKGKKEKEKILESVKNGELI